MGKKKKPQDQPLEVQVVDSRLVISIGIDTLAFCVKHHPQLYGEDGEPLFNVTNASGFAVDVSRELQREEEDGTTLLHIALDRAIEAAIEDGSVHVEERQVAADAQSGKRSKKGR